MGKFKIQDPVLRDIVKSCKNTRDKDCFKALKTIAETNLFTVNRCDCTLESSGEKCFDIELSPKTSRPPLYKCGNTPIHSPKQSVLSFRISVYATPKN